MDKQKTATDILAKTLPLVPFEGWNQRTLQQAATAAGYKKTDVIRVFPGGTMDAVNAFIKQGDAKMQQALQNYSLDTMKIRQRVATAVRVRILTDEAHREAVRKTVALQALPLNCHHAMRNLYDTVDAIWYAVGDTSTDFNFYTKRLMLAGVYASTLLYWLDDKSPGFESTWTFLDRRIEDVMRIEKAKQRVRSWMGRTASVKG